MLGTSRRLDLSRVGVLLTLMLVVAHGGLRGQGSVHLVPRAQPAAALRVEPGSLLDAAEDQNGRVLILDARARVTVADSRLRVLTVVARQPGGPMLFRDPVSVGILADGRVAVLDRARQVIRMLRLNQGGTALIEADTVAISTPAEGMCVASANTFLIYGALAGSRLHVFDMRGRLLRSFAPADSIWSAPAQDQLAMGRIGCDVTNDEVTVTSAFLPIVEAFRISTGERTWVDTLRPFRASTVTDRARGVSVRTGPGGHSLVQTVLTLPGCRLLQAVYVGRQDGGRTDTVVSYLYRNAARGWEPAQLGIPLLFPLRGSSVLSVALADTLVQVQRLTIDGCVTSPRPRTDRRRR